jgi:hypothetical protein
MFMVPEKPFSTVPDPLYVGALLRNFPTFDSSLKVLMFFNWPFVTLKLIVPFSVRARLEPIPEQR